MIRQCIIVGDVLPDVSTFEAVFRVLGMVLHFHPIWICDYAFK